MVSQPKAVLARDEMFRDMLLSLGLLSPNDEDENDGEEESEGARKDRDNNRHQIVVNGKRRCKNILLPFLRNLSSLFVTRACSHSQNHHNTHKMNAKKKHRRSTP